MAMISSDSIRGYNDVIILSILNEGDSYGYEVSKEIRTRTNQLYMNKEKLQERLDIIGFWQIDIMTECHFECHCF